MTEDPVEFDRRVRVSVYRHFAEQGNAPDLAATSAEVAASVQIVKASLERLAAARVLVLHPETRRIWMAMPFSAVPTAFTVRSGRRHWWACCAWDALGISAMLRIPVDITTDCPDCGNPPVIRTNGLTLLDGEGVVHFAVPPPDWWNDIGYT